MVGAGDVIAHRLGRVAAEKDGAGVAHQLEERFGIGGGDLENLLGEGARVDSVGVEAGELDPLAVEVMKEIGIALSTMAIITRRAQFWFGAMGLGAVGLALFALAYLG